MLVDANQYQAPAMFQGLMLIGGAIWAAWLFGGGERKSDAPCHVFLALWTVFSMVVATSI